MSLQIIEPWHSPPATGGVRYLAPASGPLLVGRMTEVSERAIAMSEAGRCVALVALGHTVVYTTIRNPGVLSHTATAAPVTDPEHEGVAEWCAIDAVALLCASGTSGSWQQPTRAAIVRLANRDRALIDRWHSAATRLVLTHQAAITKVAEAHADDAAPAARALGDDAAQVEAWQKEQAHIMRHLVNYGLSRG